MALVEKKFEGKTYLDWNQGDLKVTNWRTASKRDLARVTMNTADPLRLQLTPRGARMLAEALIAFADDWEDCNP